MTAVEVLRAVAGVVCGAVVAALGAVILGEYEFTGALPFVAGVLFGLVVGEVVVGVGKLRGWPSAVAAAALGFGGIAWAGWIDAGRGLEPMKGLVWVGAALAALVALVRVSPLGAGSDRGLRADER